MALSESKHHTLRGQKKDGAGKEAREVQHGRVLEAPPQGSRPPCLREPRGPQERIQQRTMEQLADDVPMVQILDIPPMRTAVRDTQLAEQLVGLSTIVSYSSLLRTMEQHVDIPLPGRGGRISGQARIGQCARQVKT